MSDSKRPAGRQRRSTAKTTPSKSANNKTIQLHQTLSDRWKSRKFAHSTRKAAYLSTLPKEPWKRVLYRLHPKRVAKYWFSREGGIMALKITGVGILVIFLLIVGLFAYFRKDLPKINDISGDKIGGSITYYDRTGKTVLWQDYDAVKRIPVASDQMSDYIKHATVAIEDKGFYTHGAFDVRGILRAGVHDAIGSGGTEGGSSITQQLVKLNEQWTDNRTIARKVKELILAVELEREYSKDDILTAYLNVAPYGGVENGVESAARDYFGVSAKDLTLPEAAMLAAIPKAPSIYSPYGSTKFNPAAGDTFDQSELTARMDYILDQMAAQKYITVAQATAAKKVNVLALIHPLAPKYQGIKAPYFVLAAKQELENKYGDTTVQRGGWKVITTLDLNIQNQAEQITADNLPNVTRLTRGLANEEANVTEDVQTGQIVSLVGGVDSSDFGSGNQNNYAASVLIPPGSSFKPYDYATLINNNNNVGAGSVLYDVKTALPGYANTCDHNPFVKGAAPCPVGTSPAAYDYDNQFPGPVTLRYALGGSRNVPAMKAMLSADPTDTSTTRTKSINKVISTATAMMDNPYVKGNTYNCYEDTDLTQPDQCNTAAAIGDGAYLHLDDHVNGLSTLARLGNAIPRTYILQINDASNKTIYKWQQPKGTQVIKQDAAYIVDNMASDPNASYLPGSCSATNCTKLSSYGYKFQRDNGWDFAVKTGTTNNGFDGLMTSWSTKYAVVSWVGNNNRNVNIQQYGAQMETLTEPMTRGIMEAAHAGLTPVNWKQPSDIKTAPAYVLNHKISSNGEIVPSPSTDIYPSWYVGGVKTTSTSQIIDKVSGKIATSCTPDLAKEDENNANVASWNIDIFNGGKANTGSTTLSTGTTQATDDVHSCNDPPPLVSLSVAGDSCDSSCTITVTASQQSGGHPLSGGSYTTAPAGTITVQLAGQTICNLTIPADSSDVYSDSSCTYMPTAAQVATLNAMVVDSVLYSGSSTSDPITFTPAPAAPVSTPISFLGDTHATLPTKTTTIKWSGGSGTVTVTQGTTALCSATASSGQCTANGNKTGTAVLSDDQNQSDSVTVTLL